MGALPWYNPSIPIGTDVCSQTVPVFGHPVCKGPSKDHPRCLIEKGILLTNRPWSWKQSAPSWYHFIISPQTPQKHASIFSRVANQKKKPIQKVGKERDIPQMDGDIGRFGMFNLAGLNVLSWLRIFNSSCFYPMKLKLQEQPSIGEKLLLKEGW